MKNVSTSRPGEHRKNWIRILALMMTVLLSVSFLPLATLANADQGVSPWTATLSVVDEDRNDVMSGPWQSSESIIVELSMSLDADLLNMSVDDYMTLLEDDITIVISKAAIPDGLYFTIPMIPGSQVPAFVKSTLENFTENANSYTYTLEFNTSAAARAEYTRARALLFELEATAQLAANPPTAGTTIIELSDSSNVTIGNMTYDEIPGDLKVEKAVTSIGGNNVTVNQKAVTGVTYKENDIVTFSITITPKSVYGKLLSVTDTLGTGFLFVSGTVATPIPNDLDWVANGNVVTLTIPDGVDITAPVELTITAKVTAAGAAQTSLLNGVSIAFEGGTASDSVTITQYSEGPVTVEKTIANVYNASGVAVTKQGTAYPVDKGYFIEYNIKVKAGTGTYAILNGLTDTLSGPLTFAPNDASVGGSRVDARYTTDWSPTAGNTTYAVTFANPMRIEKGGSLDFKVFAKVGDTFTAGTALGNAATAADGTGATPGSGTIGLPQITEGPANVTKTAENFYYKLDAGTYTKTNYEAGVTKLNVGDLLPFSITVSPSAGQYTILTELRDILQTTNLSYAAGTEIINDPSLTNTVNEYYTAKNSGYTWVTNGSDMVLSNLGSGLKIDVGSSLTVKIIVKVTAGFAADNTTLQTISYTNRAKATPKTGSASNSDATVTSYEKWFDQSLTTQIVRRYNADGTTKDSSAEHIYPISQTKLVMNTGEYVRVNVVVKNDAYSPVDGVKVVAYIPSGYEMVTSLTGTGISDTAPSGWVQDNSFISPDDAWSGLTAYTCSFSDTLVKDATKTLYLYLRVTGDAATLFAPDYYVAAEIYDFHDAKISGNTGWHTQSNGAIYDRDSTPDMNPINDLNNTAITSYSDEKYNNIGTAGTDEDDFDFTFVSRFVPQSHDAGKVNTLTKHALSKTAAAAILPYIITESGDRTAFTNQYTYSTDGIFTSIHDYIVYEVVINNYGIEELHGNNSTFREILPEALKIYQTSGNKNALLLERYTGNPRVSGSYINASGVTVNNVPLILMEDSSRYNKTTLSLAGISTTSGVENGSVYGVTGTFGTAADMNNRHTLELAFTTNGSGQLPKHTDPYACYKLYLIMVPSDTVYESNQKLTNDVELKYSGHTLTESEKTAHWAALAGGAAVIKYQKLASDLTGVYSGALLTAVPDSQGKVVVDYKIDVLSNKAIQQDKIKTEDYPKADSGIGINIGPIAITFNGNSDPVYMTAATKTNPTRIEISNDKNIPAVLAGSSTNTHSLTYAVTYSDVVYGKLLRNAVAGTNVYTIVPVKLTLTKHEARRGAAISGYEFTAKWEDGTTVTDINGNNVIFDDSHATVYVVPPTYNPEGGVQTFKMILTETKTPDGFLTPSIDFTVIIKSDANGNLQVESVNRTDSNLYEIAVSRDLEALIKVYNRVKPSGPIESPTPSPAVSESPTPSPEESDSPSESPKVSESPDIPTSPQPSPQNPTPTDPDIPDVDIPEGSHIERNEDGEYIVFDENGVPLGHLELNDDGEWEFILDDELPLDYYPATGDETNIFIPVILMILSGSGIILLITYPRKKKD